MKVRSTTWVSVGNGTIPEIMEALRASPVSNDARVISVEAEGFSITGDDGVIMTPMKMKFAWETEV